MYSNRGGEVLETSLCNLGLLDVSGAAFHTANLSLQLARSVATDVEQAFGATLILFYVWAALTPLVLWLGGRFAFERPKLLRNLLIHPLLCVPVSLVPAAARYWSDWARPTSWPAGQTASQT